MKYRPKYGFTNYRNDQLADKAKFIHDNMSPLPQFNAPPVAYAALLILINNFKNLIAACLSHDTLKIALRNEAREQLTQALVANAVYIMSITSEKEEILQTGYDVVERGGPVGIPNPPSQVVGVSYGNQGIKLDWEKCPGAVNYIVYISDAEVVTPEMNWIPKAFPTSTKAVIQGLSPLKYYWVSICANGAEGLSLMSNPIRVLSI